jgi:hypothetical protein
VENQAGGSVSGQRAGDSARASGEPTASEPEPEPDDEPEPDAELRLGTIFQLEARQAGHSDDWREYLAGRLLIPPGQSPPFGLLAEPVPADARAAAAAAARWRVDPDLLWLVVKTARRCLRSAERRW